MPLSARSWFDKLTTSGVSGYIEVAVKGPLTLDMSKGEAAGFEMTSVNLAMWEKKR